ALHSPPPIPAAPEKTRIVHWLVYTDPPGATVVRVSDGFVLGQTPWQSEHEAGAGSEELRLRLPGHVQRLIRLCRTSDVTRRDTLEGAPASAPTPAADAVKSSQPDPTGKTKRDSSHKKPRNVAIEFED